MSGTCTARRRPRARPRRRGGELSGYLGSSSARARAGCVPHQGLGRRGRFQRLGLHGRAGTEQRHGGVWPWRAWRAQGGGAGVRGLAVMLDGATPTSEVAGDGRNSRAMAAACGRNGPVRRTQTTASEAHRPRGEHGICSTKRRGWHKGSPCLYHRGAGGMVPPWPYFGHGEHTQCMCGTEAFPSVLGSVRRRSVCVRACVRVWDVVEPRAWPRISPSVENVTA